MKLVETNKLDSVLMGSIASITVDTLIGGWTSPGKQVQEDDKQNWASRFEDHQHKIPEICLQVSGESRLFLNNSIYNLKPNNIVVIPPFTMHSESFQESQGSYQLAWWMFNENKLNFHITNYNSSHQYELVCRIELYPLAEEVRIRCKRIWDLALSSKEPKIEILKEALYTISLRLYRESLIITDCIGNSLHQSIIRKAMLFIKEQIELPLTMSDVSDAVMLSPNYLTVLFKEVHGMSLSSYIRQERMNYAKQLLNSEVSSIKEVAYRLGFTDQYAFSHMFKRTTGVSPSQYREQQFPR